MAKSKIYRTAAYVRLSKGDLDKDGMVKSESDSVTNQKLLIEDFINGHPDLELAGIYIDDGYTGTNFDRPKMKELMADVDAGKIDCIVCKDLSRFGRERIETGTYIAKTFKEKGVRFIAINDHYDTLTADGAETHIVMPIKALTNDSFSRDISIKVRSSQTVKRERGEFISAFAPYGYRKSDVNRNLLVPDDYAADIVRDIFAKKIAGYSASGIASELNESGILSPAEYKKKQGQRFSTGFKKGGKSKWSAQTVTRILRNEVYAGNLAQGKRSRVSYKVRKELAVPETDWVRCEDTHEAIVSRTVFDTVQILMRRDTIRGGDGRESYLYAGLLFCADCGHAMVRRNDPRNKEKGAAYICSSYNVRHSCSRHAVSEQKLNGTVLEFLQDYIGQLADTRRLAKELGSMEIGYDDAKKHDREIQSLKDELKRYSALKASLYQDMRDGLISESQFARYRDDYSRLETDIQSSIEGQERIIGEIYERGLVADLKLSHMKEKLNVGGLDRALVVTFIDRIVIYEGGQIEIRAKFEDRMEKVINMSGYCDGDGHSSISADANDCALTEVV